jgi:kinesin family member 2/24
VIELHELGKDVLSYDTLKRKYGEDTDDLCTDHEKLIEQILEEEDKLINCHRSHIDDVVSVVKDEMTLLNEVDKPGSDVEHYVKKLDEVLLSKIKLITKLRSNVLSFFSHLKTEEQMSKLY